MQLRGALAGTIVAQIVDIHSVDDVRDAALARHFVEPGKQLVLAVEAPVRIVLDVIRIVEFVGRDVLVAEARARARTPRHRLCANRGTTRNPP